jgi:uncharacterized protein
MRLIVLILFFMAAYVLIRGLIQTFSAVQRQKRSQDSSSLRGTEMVQDPVCESYIPKEKALSEKIQGKTYFFCSPQCAKQFKRAKLSEKAG